MIWSAPERVARATRQHAEPGAHRGGQVRHLAVIVVEREPHDAGGELVVGRDHRQERRIRERDVLHPLERAHLVRRLPRRQAQDRIPRRAPLLIEVHGDRVPVDLAVAPDVGVVDDVGAEQVDAEEALLVVLHRHEARARRVLGLQLQLVAELGGEADSASIGESFGEVVEAHEGIVQRTGPLVNRHARSAQ